MDDNYMIQNYNIDHPPKYIMAFELKHQGLSNQQISDILHVKIPRIREYLYKATHLEQRLKLLRKCNQKYYLNNIDTIKIKKSEYHKRNKNKYRKEHLGTVINGIPKTYYHLNKRDYPLDNICELCHNKRKRLMYHHWDNSNLNKGMWICCGCHDFAGKFENGYSEKYFDIKQKIDNTFLSSMEANGIEVIKKSGLERLLK